MARSLDLVIQPCKRQDPQRLFTANGQAMENKGSVEVDLEINGRIYRQKFLVLTKLNTPIICGCDFLRDHNAVINLSVGEVIFHGRFVTSLIRKKDFVGIARLTTGVRVAPKKQFTVNVCVSGNRYQGKVSLLDLPEPIRGLKVRNAICNSQRIMRVTLENETERPINLERNRPVATCIRTEDKSGQVNLAKGVGDSPAPQQAKVETQEERKVRVQRTVPSDRTIEDLELKINKGNHFDEAVTGFWKLMQDNTDLFAVSNSEFLSDFDQEENNQQASSSDEYDRIFKERSDISGNDIEENEWKIIEELIQTSGESEDDELWIYCDHRPEEHRPQFDDNLIQAIQEQLHHKVLNGKTKNEKRSSSGKSEVMKETVEKESDSSTIGPHKPDQGEPIVNVGIEICAGSGSEFARLQQECTELGPIVRYLENGDIGEGSMKQVRKILNLAEWHFIDKEGILCSTSPRMSKRESFTVQEYKVVPVTLREEIMQGFHQFGHCGISRLQELILKAGYKWESLYADVRNYVLSCEACSIAKRGIVTPKANLKPLEIPDSPGEVLQIDLLGPYSPSKEGHIAVLSVIDRLTSYVWLFPLKGCTSDIIAKKLFKVFTDVGTPKILISDNASNLVSKTMQDMAQRLGIKRVNVVPYHSQSNGKIERTHRTIQDNLRALLSDKEHTQWNTQIPEIVWGLRSAVSATTKRSPFELRHGHQMRLPIDRRLQSKTGSELTETSGKEITEYARNLEERMSTLHKTHKLKLQEEQEQMKERYDTNIRKKHSYRVGEFVYLKNPGGVPGISRKLQMEYHPEHYEIIRLEGEHNVKLRNTQTRKELHHMVHVDNLKPIIIRKGLKRRHSNEEQEALIKATESARTEGPTKPAENKESPNSLKPMINSKSGMRSNSSSVEQTAVKAADEVSIDDPKKSGKTTESVLQERDNAETVYKIVQQKGSAEKRKFRIQWKTPSGNFESCWDEWENVPLEMIQQWERTHGRTGKTLQSFRRKKKY